MNRSAQLEEIIATYLEAEQSGTPLDLPALFTANPDLAGSLMDFVANHQRLLSAADEPASPAGVEPGAASVMQTLARGLDGSQPTPSEGLESSGFSVDHHSVASGSPVGPDGSCLFGDYELLEEIARGGMGVVYKARQSSLNRIVALKMILAGSLASEEDVRRFRVEAESAARLDHLGIVPIHDIGEHAGQHYFSMAYVEGQSLADRVKQGPLPPREAAGQVRKIAEAIQFAHRNGVIHRDLKPANVLLDRHGEPKVTDFGLAKRVEVARGLTATGQILGTPAYMPPEQALGRQVPVSESADVYSLGAILYCLLTGHPPFQAASAVETLKQVVEKDPVPPRRLNPAIPRDLDTICLKCLRKEPHRRYESAATLADDLGRWLNQEPILARPVSSPEKAWLWCRRQPVVAALLAAVVLLLVGGTAIATYFAAKASHEAHEAAQSAQAARASAAEARRRQVESERNLLRAEEHFELARQSVEQFYLRTSTNRLLNEPGMQGLQRELLGLARDFYLRLASRRRDDPQLNVDLLETSLRLADIHGAMGDTPAATQAAQEVVEQLTRTRVALTNNQRLTLARALAIRGKLHAQQGHTGDAERDYQDSLALLAALPDDVPPDPASASGQPNGSPHSSPGNAVSVDEITTLRGSTHTALGTIYTRLDRGQDAEREFQAAVRHLQHQTKLDVDGGVNRLWGLGQVHNNLSLLYEGQNRLEDCQRALEAAIAAFEEADRRHPGILSIRYALALAYCNLGACHNHYPDRGDPARLALEKALPLARRLATDNPTVAEYRNTLARTLNNLGNTSMLTGKHSQAESLYLEAAAVWRQLVAAQPEVVEYQLELGGALQNLGGVLDLQRRRADSLARLNEAKEHLLEVTRAEPGNALAVRRLGQVYPRLAMLNAQAGSFQQATEAWAQAARLAPPERRDDFLVQAGGCSCNLGHSLRNKGEAEQSLPWFDRAESLLQPIAAQPRATQARQFLRNTYWGRAEALHQLERFDEALQQWQQALNVDREVSLHEVTLGYARTLAAAGRYAQAAEVVEQAELPLDRPDLLCDAAELLLQAAQGASQDASYPPEQRVQFANELRQLARNCMGQLIERGYLERAELRRRVESNQQLRELRIQLERGSGPASPPDQSTRSLDP